MQRPSVSSELNSHLERVVEERAEVLTEYFTDLTAVDKNVRESDGWEHIEDYPGLWNRVLDTA